MILRLSDSLSRGLVVVAAILVALWLSFFGIRTAIARYGAEGDTLGRLELAVHMEPGNPRYWYLLGRYQQFNLEEPDSALAEEFYRKAIALNPLDSDALLDLGTTYELEGKTTEAREAYLQAKKINPTSADISWRYGNFLLREGELPQAYAELRRAIEVDPRLAAAAFSRAYRANPSIDEILEQLLPPQQGAYVSVIAEAANEKQLAVAMMLWARLLTFHPHLQFSDIDRLVSQLLQVGQYAEARRIWDQGVATMNLPPLLQPVGSVIWDPSFESSVSSYSFAWQIRPLVDGARISFDSTERHSGNQSLRLSFDGKHNPNLEAACAVGVVQPGTSYLFSGWIKTEDLRTDRGIGFQLRSLGNYQIPVVNTREVHGTNAWTMIDQLWSAGSDIRRVQICVTRDPSENRELRIAGNAWVDDVNLVPQPAEHHKP